MILPEDKRGSTWIFGILREGENGSELAERLPYLPEDIKQDDIFIWTKVTAGERPRAVVGVKNSEGLKPFGCVLEGLEVIH